MTAPLNDEWRRDYERRLAPAPAPVEWRTDPRLGSFGHVVEALAELEDSTPPARVEEVLSALVELARTGERHAARVLVQFLLPCFVRVAFSRHVPEYGSREQALDALLVTAWEAIRTGVELQGRPVKVALLRTIEHRALWQPVRVARRRAGRELLVEEMDERSYAPWPMSDRTNPGEAVIRLLAKAARSGLREQDARLLGRLSVGGVTCQELGAVEGVTERAIRARRAAAVRRLTELVA